MNSVPHTSSQDFNEALHRLSPRRLERVCQKNEQIAKLCRRGLVSEDQRRRYKGFDVGQREVERARESQTILALVKERDYLVAKHHHFTQHIPAPNDPSIADDHHWVRQVLRHAQHMGLDVRKDYKYLDLVAEALQCPLPKGWVEVRGKRSRHFENHVTQAHSAEHPLEGYFKTLIYQKTVIDEAARRGKSALSAERAYDSTRTLINGALTRAKLGKVSDELRPRNAEPEEANDQHAQRQLVARNRMTYRQSLDLQCYRSV